MTQTLMRRLTLQHGGKHLHQTPNFREPTSVKQELRRLTSARRTSAAELNVSITPLTRQKCRSCHLARRPTSVLVLLSQRREHLPAANPPIRQRLEGAKERFGAVTPYLHAQRSQSR